MYKTKLQEICQQRKWGLPKYSGMKDGPDHNPRFKASVFVNGVSFDSPFSAKSSKEAHNLAAQLAFLHFTSPSPPPLSSSSMSSAQSKAEEPKIAETSEGLETHLKASGVADVQSQYKSQLQNYAQWKKLDSPLYSSLSEGPAHALHFKATVTVDGRTFTSPDFFKTSKEAECAAAKTALLSLSFDSFQGDDSGFYKNLLQELTQREDLSIPVYRTIKCGVPHMPTFFSRVEVEGEVFYGKAGKSKKEAEAKVAKVTYAVLKERSLNRIMGIAPSNLVAEESTKSSPSPNLSISVESQNLKCESQLVSSPDITSNEHAEDIKNEVEEVNSANITTNSKAASEDSLPSSTVPCLDKMIGSKDSSSCSQSLPISPKDSSFCSPTWTHQDVFAPLVSETTAGKAVGTVSYLLSNRVRVYTCFPDIAFPKNITVLPVSDNKWVAVSLEFPNEEGN